MGSCIITFRSVTPAQHAERLLRGAGVYCVLGRTPRWMEEQGCGYSIRFSSTVPEESVKLLRDQRIPFRKIYIRNAGGELEEVQL